MSNTQRTLKTLRDRGCTCEVVERWNAFSRRRIDLFHFIDIIALDPERGIIGVQSCGSSHAAHKRKIIDDCAEYAMERLKCGGKIELWSWTKRKLKRGGKAMRWMPRIEEFTLENWDAPPEYGTPQ